MTVPTYAPDLAAERDSLLRYCLSFTGDPDSAEDLTQLTLLEAWRHEEDLREPAARRGWLFAIARRQCLMWARRSSRDRSRHEGEDASVLLPDDFDLEVELERDELARLLDRALDLLPRETRDVLVRRYVEEAPQAEVAELLGLSEGAVEARLHRGKLALRRILRVDLQDEARAFGLVGPEDAGWTETRMWCPGCGSRRVQARLDHAEGRFSILCPACALPYNRYVHAYFGSRLDAIKTFRPAVNRVLENIHAMFHTSAADGFSQCDGCGAWLPIERVEDGRYLVTCKTCGWDDFETWHSLSWSVPEVREFWRRHPRMRFLPVHEMEVEGGPAVLTAFEAVDSAERIEVLARRDTCRVIAVHGAVPSR